MRIVQIHIPILFCILILVGCTGSPIPTVESISTDAPTTNTSAVQFDVIDIREARSHSLAVAPDGSIYFIYGKDYSLFVSRSGDGGRTFSEGALATGAMAVHVLPIERPAIAVDDRGHVAIAWLEMPPDFNGAKAWYSLSEDGGKTFSPAVLVADEPEGEVTMVQVALDRTGNPILTWLNGSELRFARSLDQGATFSEPSSIGDGSCECCQPQALVINDTIHIAYRSLEPGNEKGDIRDIVMIRSTDGGESFAPVTRVSDEHWYLPACPIAGPSMAVQDGKIYVAWMDGRQEPAGSFSRGDIWLTSSQDGGASFSENIRINTDQSTHHTLPSIAIGPGGRIHVAWEAQGKATRQAFLYYAVSDDGGKTFTTPQILANNADSARGNPGKPVIVANAEGNITLAWLDRQGVRLAAWTDTK